MSARLPREALVREVDGRRLLDASKLGRLQADADQAIGLPVGQGREKHAIHDGEHRRDRADTEDEREDRRNGEDRRAPQ